MLFPSWIRKMNIVLFERNALNWWTRVFCKIWRSRSLNFVDVKVIWQASMGDVLDASFKTLFNKIAAELLWQKSWKVWTEMLSSRMKQFFFERYAGVRLIYLSQVSFQRLKVLIALIFQVVKPFCFTNVESVEKLWSSYFSEWNVYSKFCKDAKLFKLFVWDKRISSAFRVQKKWTS